MTIKLEAVIWDMDGVIVDTGRYHLRAWQSAFGRIGIKFTEAKFRQGFGKRNDLMAREVVGEDFPKDKLDAIADEKEGEYLRLVGSSTLKPLPGAVELIQALDEQGIKKAIASSATLPNIRDFLKKLNIADYFQALASGLEVSVGRPNPELVLLAASRLGIPPENCAVIEDSIAGIRGAKSAGMKCVAVTTTNAPDLLWLADLVVDSLSEVTVEDLKSLFE